LINKNVFKKNASEVKTIIESHDTIIKHRLNENLNMNIIDMCIVADDKIVCSSQDEATVKLYENLGLEYLIFENVCTMTEFKGKKIRPIGITFNKKRKRIYISDSAFNRIIMTTTQLYGVKSTSEEKTELAIFRFITCNDSNIFVSDFGNSCIQILSLDLDFLDSIKLEFRPEMLNVSHSTLCVTGDDFFCFYSLKTKALKSRYECNFARINYIDEFFFVLDWRVKIFFQFDNDGFLVDEIKAYKIFDTKIVDPYDGCLCLFKKSLMISCYSKNEIIELKINEDSSDSSENSESDSEIASIVSDSSS
jgi:hypothetical protein